MLSCLEPKVIQGSSKRGSKSTGADAVVSPLVCGGQPLFKHSIIGQGQVGAGASRNNKEATGGVIDPRTNVRTGRTRPNDTPTRGLFHNTHPSDGSARPSGAGVVRKMATQEAPSLPSLEPFVTMSYMATPYPHDSTSFCPCS